MHVLESELEARERAVLHDESLLSAEGQAFPNFKMRTTTSALFTKHSGPTCTYYKQSHPSNSCKMVTNPVARKGILIKQGRCFVCLRKDISAKTVLQSMNVSSVRVNTISAFVHPVAIIAPIQEQHPSKNILRSNQGTIVPQAVTKMAPTLV